MSLDKIISNPELAHTVSLEWIQKELQKQPYNRFLQDLLEQRTSSNDGYSFSNHENLIESIISDNIRSTQSSFFIRDVILSTRSTFAEAEKSESKESRITSAAIGAGAIITGSIATGANEAADPDYERHEEPMSNSEQIEESGLLGFLNRLDGTIPRKKSSPAVDPMLKKENYEKQVEVTSSKVLDLTDENLEEPEELEAEEESTLDGQIPSSEEKNEIEEENALPEQIPSLEEKNAEEEEEIEGYPDQLIFTDNVTKKKKKKKKKFMPKSQYRWSSETAADYTMSGLAPFTVWINTVDGVEFVGVDGKKKKKKEQFKSLESKPEIASEPLAELLINQGHYQDAIDMYKQLSLKNPEKSSFFAAKIETIKDKI